MSLACVLSATHAWFPSFIFDDSLNGPSWSVSCEVFFCVAFVLFRPLLFRVQSFTQGLGSATFLWLLLLVIAFIIRGLNMHNSPLKYCPALRLPQFFLGCVTGRMHALGHFDTLRNSTASAVGATTSILILVTCAALAQPFSQSPLYPFFISGLLDPMFTVLLICLASEQSTHVSTTHKILSSSPFLWLGMQSYSLYLLQSPVDRMLRGLGHYEGDPSSGTLPSLLMWPVLVTGTFIVYHTIETSFFW